METLINSIFAFISHYHIGDVLPLGKTLHLILPIFITLFLSHKGMSFRHIILWVFILGASKELYDLTAINSHIADSCYDMVLDMAYPTLVLFVKILKSFDQNEKLLHHHKI